MNTAHRHGWRTCAVACAVLSLNAVAAPAVAGPFMPVGGPSAATDDPGPDGYAEARKAAMSRDYADHTLRLAQEATSTDVRPAAALRPRPVTGSADRPGPAHPGRVIRLTAVGSEAEAVDLDPAGPSLGDLAAFTDTMMRGGRAVGHSGYVCTTTSVDLGESHCVATIVLDGRGTIVGQGLVPDADGPFRVAVTGGTGSFDATGGELLVRSVPGEADRLALVLRLRR